MKRLMYILLIFVTYSAYGQGDYTVPTIPKPPDYGSIKYIDPDVATNGDGSIGNPYNTLTGLTIQSNTAYLIKAGTTLNENISLVWNNNYLGKYGKWNFPVLSSGLNLRNASHDVVFDSLSITTYGDGAYNSIIRLLGDSTQTGIVFANCKIYGQNNGLGYPYRNILGGSRGLIIYHCEISYSNNDGIYGGYYEDGIFVSDYFHHNNMSGLNNSNSTGDCFQLDGGPISNLYIANCFFDRHRTIWKFCLIIDGAEWSNKHVTVEWNTFVSARPGNGGACLHWFVGDSCSATKNLFNTEPGEGDVSATHIIESSANEAAPYGIRDNQFFGPGPLAAYDIPMPSSNKSFPTYNDYLTYLQSNGIQQYGSDIDTSNFWAASTPSVDPCSGVIIVVSDSVISDIDNASVGEAYLTVTGGTSPYTYAWNNDSVQSHIIGVASGNYSVTVTDDSSCTANSTITVPLIHYNPITEGLIRLHNSSGLIIPAYATSDVQTHTDTLLILTNLDDGGIYGHNSIYLPDGESGTNYFGEFPSGYYYFAFFRFKLTNAIPAGAIITHCYLNLYGADTWQWTTNGLNVYFENSDNAVQVSSVNDHPVDGSNARLLTSAVRWPSSGGITWNLSARQNSTDLKSILQYLVTTYSGLSVDNYVQVWLTKDGIENSAMELGTPDYSSSPTNSAKLIINYSY